MDTLVLEQGEAHGGKETDKYVILSNQQNHPVEVNIHDEKGEESIIIFKLESFSFSLIKDKAIDDQYDIKITLDSFNKNIPRTTVFIKDAYHAQNKDTLKLNGKYNFYTEDGLFLSSYAWPKTIKIDERGYFPFTPKFIVSYDTSRDFIHQDYLKNTNKDEVSISLQKKQGNLSADLIMVGQDGILLDENMHLNLVDTPFKDTIKGNKENNVITVLYGGDDYLEGGEGHDIYRISDSPENNKNRTISINNKDATQKPEKDLLILPVPLIQINHIQTIGQDIILSSKHEPEKNLKICFQNFLLDESYRHISIFDSKQNQLFELNVDEQGKPRFYCAYSHLSSTENADTLFISDADTLTGNLLEAKGGDDFIIDYSHLSPTIDGGKGNDVIIAMESGNKDLNGDEGNDQLFSGEGDDSLMGGQGNDLLSGGKGNDMYYVGRSDGHTTIEDNGGNDILFLMNIHVDELLFTQIEENIYIALKNIDIKTFSIELSECGSGSEEKK